MSSLQYANVDYERRLLTCILKYHSCFDYIRKKPTLLKKEYFKDEALQFIFLIIKNLINKVYKPLYEEELKEILINTVKKNKKDTEQENFLILIDKIFTEEVSEGSFNYLLEQLQIMARVRKVCDVTEAVKEELSEGNIQGAEKALTDARIQSDSRIYVNAGTIVDDFTFHKQLIAEKKANPEKYVGIRTGLELIDKNDSWRGFYRGEYYLFLGYTGMGKSWTLNELSFYACLQNIPTVLFTIEMNKWKAQARWYVRLTGIPFEKFRDPIVKDEKGDWVPNLSNEDMQLWETQMAKVKERKVQYKVISFDQGATVSDLKNELYNTAEQDFEPQLVLVDQLPDLKAEGSTDSRDWKGLGNISEGLAQLARNWNDQQGLVVVAVHQTKKTSKHKPILTEEDSAYSPYPVQHATGVSYLAQTRKDELYGIIRQGIIKNRDGGKELKQAMLCPSFKEGKLHDKTKYRDLINKLGPDYLIRSIQEEEQKRQMEATIKKGKYSLY